MLSPKLYKPGTLSPQSNVSSEHSIHTHELDSRFRHRSCSVNPVALTRQENSQQPCVLRKDEASTFSPRQQTEYRIIVPYPNPMRPDVFQKTILRKMTECSQWILHN